MSENTFEISGQATLGRCVNWQPTVKLRFVERIVTMNGNTVKTMTVLQQLWADMCSQNKEWRDVPVETEE